MLSSALKLRFQVCKPALVAWIIRCNWIISAGISSDFTKRRPLAVALHLAIAITVNNSSSHSIAANTCTWYIANSSCLADKSSSDLCSDSSTGLLCMLCLIFKLSLYCVIVCVSREGPSSCTGCPLPCILFLLGEAPGSL